MEVHACSIEVERPAYGPQHRDECHGGQKGLSYTANKIDGRLRGDAHIVGDAIFRVGVVAAHEVELIIAPISDPPVDKMVVEPRAPPPLERHPQKGLTGAETNA